MLFTSFYVLVMNLPILEKLSENCSKEQKYHVLIFSLTLMSLDETFKNYITCIMVCF